MKSTKDSLIIGVISFFIFMALITLANSIYPTMPFDFMIVCGLGVGVGNFLAHKFFIPKE